MTASVANPARSKRILMTARMYGAGGIETHFLNLSRLLVERGAEVTLVVRLADPQTPLVQMHREIPLRILDTPFARHWRWFRLSTAWAMTVWSLQLDSAYFDMLYTVEVSRFTCFLSRFVRRGGFVIGNRIGEPLRDCDSLDATGRQHLNGFIVESDLQASAVSRLYADLPVAAIPLMAYVNAPPRQPRHLNDGLHVAFLGRYDRAKGVYRLLDIWQELPIQPARLDFYGHGAEQEGLKHEVRRRGLQDRVEIHGGWTKSEELTSILANTDLLVLPSETEGLPLVLLESIAHGVPFVATDVGAVRTLAADNSDVRVVPLDNAALARGIVEMAAALRAGLVSGSRLQEYHRRRYSGEYVGGLWAQALLEPERFWAERRAPAELESSLTAAVR